MAATTADIPISPYRTSRFWASRRTDWTDWVDWVDWVDWAILVDFISVSVGIVLCFLGYSRTASRGSRSTAAMRDESRPIVTIRSQSRTHMGCPLSLLVQ